MKRLDFGGRMNHVEGPQPQVARDAFGRELQVGDEIVLNRVVPTRMVILEIRPDLSPKAAPNTMILTGQFTMITKLGANMPTPELILYRTAEEAGRVSPTEPPAAPAAEGEKPTTITTSDH